MIIEWVTSLSLDALKKKVDGKIDETKVKAKLNDYLLKKSKIDKLSNLADEIDYQGLVEYVGANMMFDIESCLFGKYKERKVARNSIVGKAKYYARTCGRPEAEKKVVKIISDIIYILNGFYKNKVPNWANLSAAQVTDDIVNKVKESEKTIVQKVDQLAFTSQFSTDNISGLLIKGNIKDAENLVDMYLNSFKGTHFLKEHFDYSFDSKTSRIVSVAKNTDALMKYPAKIKGTATVKVGSMHISRLDSSIMNKAFREQLPIKINIETATKYLGDYIDPSQAEAENMVGQELVIHPKPFPPPFPCSIILDDKNTVIDYLLLRTEKILEDGTYIVTNTEQVNFKLFFSFELNVNKSIFNMNVKNTPEFEQDIDAKLMFLRFLKSVNTSKTIKIKLLAQNEILYTGSITQGDIEMINLGIQMLENIKIIEKHFKCKVIIPKEIIETDLNAITYVASLVNKHTCEMQWTALETDLVISKETKDNLGIYTENFFRMSYIGTITISIFNESLTIPIARTYDKVLLQDADRVKRKIKVMDIGDSINVKYISSLDGTPGLATDVLYEKALDVVGELGIE